MKLFLAVIGIASVLGAQVNGVAVSVSPFPYLTADDSINYYDGSNNLIYSCVANSNTPGTNTSQPSVVTVSAISNASPASFTATAHGFGDFATHGATMTPTVKVAGLTGNWTPLNGVWKAIITTANAFTIAVDSTSFGAVTGTVAVTTLAPRWNLPVWSIWGAVYTSGNLLFSGWASAPGGAGATNLTAGSTGGNKTCSSRTTYSYQ